MRFPKPQSIRLKGDNYKRLRDKVLARDAWSCRRCGARHHLQVHHLIKRSHLRLDIMANLCTLCNGCHELVERHIIDVIGEDANILAPAEGCLLFVPRRT